MNIIVYFLTFLFTLASCNFSNDKKQENTMYYYRHTTRDREFRSKKFEEDKIQRHDKLDVLVGQADFIFEHKGHELRVYTNRTHCAIDAARLTYELDNLGIIYSKSTYFEAYSVLKSNNDNSNQILERALEFIIFHPDLNVNTDILQPKKSK